MSPHAWTYMQLSPTTLKSPAAWTAQHSELTGNWWRADTGAVCSMNSNSIYLMCILNTLPVSPSFFKNGRQNFMMQQFGTFIYCNETNLDNKFKRACFQLIKNNQQKHFFSLSSSTIIFIMVDLQLTANRRSKQETLMPWDTSTPSQSFWQDWIIVSHSVKQVSSGKLSH